MSASPGSFGARPLTAIRQRYLLHGIAALPRTWRRRWMIARMLATPPWFNSTAVRAIYQEAARRTAATGIKHVVDHEIPLQHPLVCGLHWHANLQVLTYKQNEAKGNKWQPDQMVLPI